MSKKNDWPLYLRKMTSPEIRGFVKRAPVVILPVGSIEQHGAHLPIDTDLVTIEYLAEKALLAARERSGRAVGVIAPALPYGGPEMGMREWPGTLCLHPETFIQAVSDIGGGLAASGFRYVILFNGCVGNMAAMTIASQRLKVQNPKTAFIVLGSTWETPDVIARVRTSGHGGMGHACELEASTSLVIDPEHVYMEKAEKGKFNHPSPEVSFDFDQPNPYYWPIPFSELAPNGVIGDPTSATAEKGRVILEANVERIVGILLSLGE